MSQTELAEAIGVSTNLISRVENNLPTTDEKMHLDLFMKFYNLTREQLDELALEADPDSPIPVHRKRKQSHTVESLRNNDIPDFQARQADCLHQTTTGTILKTLRELYGLSLEELSARIEVPIATLEKYEQDAKELSKADLKTFTELYRIKASDLDARKSIYRISTEDFGKRIRYLLNHLHMTFATLNKETGIGNNTINKYEHNTMQPTMKVINKLSDFFHIPAPVLLDNRLSNLQLTGYLDNFVNTKYIPTASESQKLALNITTPTPTQNNKSEDTAKFYKSAQEKTAFASIQHLFNTTEYTPTDLNQFIQTIKDLYIDTQRHKIQIDTQ